jgi:hypothetical protein
MSRATRLMAGLILLGYAKASFAPVTLTPEWT